MAHDDDLNALEHQFEQALLSSISEAGTEALLSLKSQYFGPKGALTLKLRGVGALPPSERKQAGKRVNQVKQALERRLQSALDARLEAEREAELRRDPLDMTLAPRRRRGFGRVHPIHRVRRDIVDIFKRMGFTVAEGPEVELDKFNFEMLNFPDDHPARDMQDTFFIRGKDEPDEAAPSPFRVLRTHTSPVQIRAMRGQGAPIRIVSPGRVYRWDSDATHSPMFHQIEGLWVDEGISMAHLKGVLDSFVKALFGERAIRLRPSYFPFVEPGVEVDIECMFCDGTGHTKDGPCRVCKTTGWLEVLGAGMVHPNVLEACDIDAEKYTGFAFGLGVDRIAMLRYYIDDIGHLFRGDARFLGQL